MVTIITRYDYEAQAKNRGSDITFDPKKNKADRSLTNQADMDAADINKIMARYEKTGVIIDTFGVERKPQYGDFTEIKDYHSMMVAIKNTERAFNQLPANLRDRFNNDPQALIDFLEDPKNDAEAVKLGLKEAPAGVEPTPEERAAGALKQAAPAAGAAGASGTGTA